LGHAQQKKTTPKNAELQQRTQKEAPELAKHAAEARGARCRTPAAGDARRGLNPAAEASAPRKPQSTVELATRRSGRARPRPPRARARASSATAAAGRRRMERGRAWVLAGGGGGEGGAGEPPAGTGTPVLCRVPLLRSEERGCFFA